MKRIKKILIYIAAALLVLLHIIAFPPITYKKLANSNPMLAGYKKGVYHMHSVFSDGKGTVDEITKAAHAARVDFAILTDHGEPNIEASKSTAFSNNVLLIGASELSLNSGHLASAGYELPDYIFPPEPGEAIREVNRDNGVTFISHPYDDKIPWTDWDVKGFTGLEILSIYSCARKISLLQLSAFPLQYLLNSNYALLNALEYPEKNIAKWNQLNTEKKYGPHRYYGIYALDVHAHLPITKSFSFNFPTYKSMFRVLTIYARTDSPKAGQTGGIANDATQASAAVIKALRAGDFFNVMEAIAPANGFRAYYIDGSGQRIQMGGATQNSRGKLVVHLPFCFKVLLKINRNGKAFKSIKKEGTQHKADNSECIGTKVEVPINQPGFYTIEVYALDSRFKKLPWIITNPFFIDCRPDQAPVGVDEIPIEIPVTLPLANAEGFFKVEKSSLCEGGVTYQVNEENQLVTDFRFKLEKAPEKKDFASVLAVRGTFDYSQYKGIVFDVMSDSRRRFWSEFRTGEGEQETWYRHSFLAEPQWRRVWLDFERFALIFGNERPLDLSDVRSLFFSINNANAYPGTEGRIRLKGIGLY
ncbi:MAG: hypothetical protein GY765_41270 [bacterium]|nr:hypothetical protein [bacterium]